MTKDVPKVKKASLISGIGAETTNPRAGKPRNERG